MSPTLGGRVHLPVLYLLRPLKLVHKVCGQRVHIDYFYTFFQGGFSKVMYGGGSYHVNIAPLATKSDEKIEKWRNLSQLAFDKMQIQCEKIEIETSLRTGFAEKICKKLSLSLSLCRRDYRWLRPRRPRRQPRLLL